MIITVVVVGSPSPAIVSVIPSIPTGMTVIAPAAIISKVIIVPVVVISIVPMPVVRTPGSPPARIIPPVPG
jgi:hypothetical protein